MNCEAYFSLEGVSSNHRIVMAKIQLSLWRNTIRTTATVHYDWSLLNNRDIRDKYALTLRSKFDALQEKTEIHLLNNKYENFINAHLEAAAECIPTNQKAKPRVPWETLGKSMQIWKLSPNAIGRTQPMPMPWNFKRHKMN